MKKYTRPELSYETFLSEDVITTSGAATVQTAVDQAKQAAGGIEGSAGFVVVL